MSTNKHDNDTLKNVHRLHDGELDEAQQAEIMEVLKNDPSMEAEARSLREIGEGLRHDTEEALRSLDTEALANEIERRVAEEQASSRSTRLRFLWKPLSFAAAAALVVAIGLHYHYRQSTSSWQPNSVIVENLETFSSKAQIYDTRLDGENEPVKVIWLFEEDSVN